MRASAHMQYVPSLQKPHESLASSDIIGCKDCGGGWVTIGSDILLSLANMAVKSVSIGIPASERCRFSSGAEGGELGECGRLRSDIRRASSKHSQLDPSVHFPHPIAVSVS